MRIKKRKASLAGVFASRSIRSQPNYHSELSDEYIDALQRKVDGEKPEGFRLTPISEPGW